MPPPAPLPPLLSAKHSPATARHLPPPALTNSFPLARVPAGDTVRDGSPPPASTAGFSHLWARCVPSNPIVHRGRGLGTAMCRRCFGRVCKSVAEQLPCQHPSALPCLGRGPRSTRVGGRLGEVVVSPASPGDSQHPACPDSVPPPLGLTWVSAWAWGPQPGSSLSLSLPHPAHASLCPVSSSPKGTSLSARGGQPDVLSHQHRGSCRHLLPRAGGLNHFSPIARGGHSSAQHTPARARSLLAGRVTWHHQGLSPERSWCRCQAG